jgi:L-malate glycosyltransferase
MIIAHLSVGDSLTTRLANWQAKEGHSVHLIMLEPEWEKLQDVKSYILPIQKPLGYYLNVYSLKKLLNRIKPDILHVHYATGCGTLGRLSGFNPTVLSVWGTDVMITPQKSDIMRWLVIKNLKYYNWICSTSKIMTKTVKKLYPESANISQIPIGVDTSIFCSILNPNYDYITIGTVKVMDKIYGTDLLIRSFAKVFNYFSSEDPAIAKKLRLKIVGGGSRVSKVPFMKDLKSLAKEMGIESITNFVGQVPNVEVPQHLNTLDIYVAMSRVESFGVAIIEASACELPVVVSDVGGLPEVVVDNKTGFIVESDNVDQCTERLIDLINNKNLRIKMGIAGRDFVKKHYEWELCFSQLDMVYQKVINP